MDQVLFTGVCTALVTPFLDGKVNYPMLEQLIRRQVEAGIKSLVVCGTTGEAPTLSDNEKIRLYSYAKSCVGDRCKIIAGTGSNSTAHAIELSKAAEEVGCDAVLVVSPYYNKATPEGLYAHYLSIAHAISIPLVMYNVPSRTGVDIPVSVYQRLSRIPNIIGVKEAGTDITKITKIRNACGDKFHIWAGNDDMIVPVIALGGKGVISTVANICPLETASMVDAALNGDFDTAADLQCRLQALIELLFCEVNPIPVKAALKQIGYDCGGCRLPLTDLSSENLKKLQSYFA